MNRRQRLSLIGRQAASAKVGLQELRPHYYCYQPPNILGEHLANPGQFKEKDERFLEHQGEGKQNQSSG